MPSYGFIAPPPEEEQTRERQNQSPSDPHIPLDTCRAGQSETNLLAKKGPTPIGTALERTSSGRVYLPLWSNAFHGALLRQLTALRPGPILPFSADYFRTCTEVTQFR
jgi:hypothetical protein